MDKVIALDNGFFKIDFSIGEGELLYQDALYFSPELYASLTSEDIQNIKEERYANWQEFLASVPVVEEPV